MSNYGEELAYWYLRLNGFFPLRNFVIHRSTNTQHSSDADLLAIRPPHVFEEVGGQPDDWHHALRGRFNFERTIGIVCEVKTGRFDHDSLFRRENIRYAILRLGFTKPEECDDLTESLMNVAEREVDNRYQIGKLLIANSVGPQDDRCIYVALDSIIEFIQARLQRYINQKYADRVYFPSELLQYMIDQERRR